VTLLVSWCYVQFRPNTFSSTSPTTSAYLLGKFNFVFSSASPLPIHSLPTLPPTRVLRGVFTYAIVGRSNIAPRYLLCLPMK
jgi:hypothetical protein